MRPQARAPPLNGEIRMSDPVDLLKSHLETAQAPCLTCSFQVGGLVVLHLLRSIRPDIPVLFLDTVHHFAETYAFRDDMARRWSLRLITLRAAEPAPGLWRTSTEACCARHKVTPLFEALESYDLWFTGLRREQSPSRAHLGETERFTLPSGKSLTKINPLAAWTAHEVSDYARRHDIPLLPLYEAGYASIGCEPCTRRPPDPAQPRSGRWEGRKVECGIHLQPVAT
jgi:phosphoadenosine phosphosulfate reductase